MNRLTRIAPAAVLALLLAGCSSGPPPAIVPPDLTVTGKPASTAQAAAPSPAASSPSAATHPAPSHAPRARYPSSWTLPDRQLSPGAVQPGYGIRDICPDVNKALEAMRPSTAEKARVYRAYGIFSHPAGTYEIDHIIPIELLGQAGEDLSNPTRNLYPELNDTPDPAMLAKYGLSPSFVHNSKDVLEDVLHEDVCAGRVPLATAQHAIATDWRAAYVRYVGPPPGSSPRPSLTHRSSAAPQPTHSREIFSAPPATHSAAPVQAGCYPKTSGGNCYRAGEFCRSSDHGASGIAGTGERISCAENGTRWRWEPA
jgi:hypothetical protein